MAHVHSIPPIPGVEDLFSLMAFLSDKDACEKRLADMEHLRDEINGIVELVGKAHEIEPLRIQAQTDREMAARELAQAREHAKQAMADVGRAAAARLADFEVSRAKAEADLNTRRDELNAQAKFIAVDREKIAAADDLSRKLEKERLAVAAQRDELNKLKKQYEDRLVAIKAAAGS